MGFAEFKDCLDCATYTRHLTDTICVCCTRWICAYCQSVCVQCEQTVCKECYKQDLCCLVRPWGEVEEAHFSNFYKNKLVDGPALDVIDSSPGEIGSKKFTLRNEVVKRSILHYVENLDSSFVALRINDLVTKHFPSDISKYIVADEKGFLAFLEEIGRKNHLLFANILCHSEDRDHILSLMEEFFRKHERLRKELVEKALKIEKQDFFQSLNRRSLLDWKDVNRNAFRLSAVGHVDGIKWCEKNGVDVVRNAEDFRSFASRSPVKVIEYLINEKGMSIDYLVEHAFLNLEMLKLIAKVKGSDEIKRIEFSKISHAFNVKTLQFLMSVGYKFDKMKSSLSSNYPEVAFELVKYEEMGFFSKLQFNEYIAGKYFSS